MYTLLMNVKKRPSDLNQLAKMLLDMVTGPHENPSPSKPNATKAPPTKKVTKVAIKLKNTKGISKKVTSK